MGHTLKEKSKFPINQKQLLNNAEFENLVVSRRIQDVGVLYSTTTLYELHRLIINSIDDELNEFTKEKMNLEYQDIGIIGSAINGWDESTPMTLTRQEERIWEIDIFLKKGKVKFRNENKWSFDWGGVVFPKGEVAFKGSDIQVEEGNYHVILNLNKNTYEFIKQDD